MLVYLVDAQFKDSRIYSYAELWERVTFLASLWAKGNWFFPDIFINDWQRFCFLDFFFRFQFWLMGFFQFFFLWRGCFILLGCTFPSHVNNIFFFSQKKKEKKLVILLSLAFKFSLLLSMDGYSSHVKHEPYWVKSWNSYFFLLNPISWIVGNGSIYRKDDEATWIDTTEPCAVKVILHIQEASCKEHLYTSICSSRNVKWDSITCIYEDVLDFQWFGYLDSMSMNACICVKFSLPQAFLWFTGLKLTNFIEPAGS